MVSRTDGMVARTPRMRPARRRRRWRAVVAALAIIAVPTGFAAAIAPADGAAASKPTTSAHGWSAVPLGARAAVSRGLGADQRTFFAKKAASGAVSLNNPAQGLHATLTHSQLELTGAHGLQIGLSSPAIGRGHSVRPIATRSATTSTSQNKVAFSSRAAATTEWFANGPYGVEQGFTLTHRPAGPGSLLITQTLSGNTTASSETDGQGVTFSSPHGVLRYQDLVVTDATGARVPARISVTAERLTITVADAHAVYPLRIDPEFQETAELSAADGVPADNFGHSVAVSGSTIVIGAYRHNAAHGAVYVYTMPASGGWADATQTAELTASDPGASDELGYSVAISGSTIVAGAPNRTTGGNAYAGAVYEWTMPAGGWASATTQTAELTASDPEYADLIGRSVAVSGSTIVSGAPSHNSVGAVYEWTMPGGGWANATQNAELNAPPYTNDDLGFGKYVGTTRMGHRVNRFLAAKSVLCRSRLATFARS
jgi:trimeric autotransporter adhesin